jgi:hypothetical protein
MVDLTRFVVWNYTWCKSLVSCSQHMHCNIVKFWQSVGFPVNEHDLSATHLK